VCALTIEADAVLAVFDETWDINQYGKARSDTNSYDVGRIGNHNVVLAHLPGPGKMNAATGATSLRSSFPNIRLCLVVGICGGVPTHLDTEKEIILGDVIISNGIVQYDFARQLPNGCMRKDTFSDNLPRPTQEIRSFLNKIEGVHGGRKLLENTLLHLTEICKTPGFEELKYLGANEDKLYEKGYRHKHQDSKDCDICAKCESDGHTCAEALNKSCLQLKCENQGLVHRSRLSSGEVQMPLIHFGRFASGDLVMKSGHHRDEIAGGERVIAFEMEGAGVWEVIPSLVIKAVCDYADSHKNKNWQGYAAAVAAACTKASLNEWIVADQEFETHSVLQRTDTQSTQSTQGSTEPLSSQEIVEELLFLLGQRTSKVEASDHSPTSPPLSKIPTVVEAAKGQTIARVTSVSSAESNRSESSSLEPTSETTLELLQACKERKLETIKVLLQGPSPVDITAKDSKGRTVLHLALGETKVNADTAKMNLILESIRYLRSHGADLTAPDNSDLRPLHYCAKTMNLPAAKYLLKYNVKVDALDSSDHTALYYVAIHAHPDIKLAKLLLTKGGKSLGNTELSPLLPRAGDNQRAVRSLINNWNSSMEG
jgi:nucleoside phosphorylase